MARAFLMMTAGVGISGLLLADSAIKGTVLLVVACAAALVLRRDSAATRHLVWLTSIVALLIVPAMSALLPGWRVLPQWAKVDGVVSDRTNGTYEADGVDWPVASASVTDRSDPTDLTSPAPAVQPPASRPQPATPPAITITVRQALPAVWLAGCVLLLLRLIVARSLLGRAERGAVKVDVFGELTPSRSPEGHTRLVRAMSEAGQQLSLQHRITLLLHPERSIPVVWGLWHHKLLLPTEAVTWSDEQLQSVLLHELAHIKRRDTLVQLLAQLACALHWFNPLVWLAAWRLHVERERACDDLVLASGVKPSSYAAHLLDVATRLTSSRWTAACGLAMARSSSLEGRLLAVLSERLNRRSVTGTLTVAAMLLSAGIAIPVAMLRAQDEKPNAASDPSAESNSGATLAPGIEEQLDWGDVVNGLRAAVVVRAPESGAAPGISLAVQNVSAAAIRFSDTGDYKQSRKLYVSDSEGILFGLTNDEPTQMDAVLQPQAVVFVSIFPPGRVKEETVLIEGLRKDSLQTWRAILDIPNAPDGAWTGKLFTADTRGATGTEGPQPTTSEGRALFKLWQSSARLNGDIPGGLLARLHDKVQEFIRNNTGDASGDSYAKKMAPLELRFGAVGDWKPADVVALMDDIAAVTTIPLETTMDHLTQHTLQHGQQLPAALMKADWGEPLESGLRMAWLLEPRAAEYHLGSEVKARIILHNSGKEPVAFITRSFHQPDHKAKLADGSELKLDSTFWTTRGRTEAYRLAPGEYIEVNTPGLGIGEHIKDLAEWSDVRAGSWILCAEGDEVTLQPGSVLLSPEAEEEGDSDWWQEFIAERLSREMPVPRDSEEREYLLYRVVRDLFGTAPSTTEGDAFAADKSPEAFDHLAVLLAKHPYGKRSHGSIRAGETSFRVLPPDSDAAKRPRIAMNPGRYTLGDDVRFVVSRKPVGERIVNEASIVYYPQGKENIAYEVELADGYDSWAAVWEPGSTVLWLRQVDSLRTFDFSDPANVKETRYAANEFDAIKIPASVRVALDAVTLTVAVPLERKGASPPASVSTSDKTHQQSPEGSRPAASDASEPPAQPTGEYSQKLFRKWQRYVRTDGKIPGALIGQLANSIQKYNSGAGGQVPPVAQTEKLEAIRIQLDESHDWPQVEVVRVLDEIEAIHNAPVGWTDLPMEFSDMRMTTGGEPLPVELESAAWGKPAENGLRAAWLLEPRSVQYSVGTVLKPRVLFHNSGLKPVVFTTETWHQYDRHTARAADGREIAITGPRYTGVTPMKTYRLGPGEYCEVSGHGIAIGAGKYEEELSIGSVGAIIEANVGETVAFSSDVDAETGGWTRPADPKEPAELWKVTIADRTAIEGPLPALAADREQLIRRVMLELFGEQPTADEIAEFVNDSSTDALTSLTTRLQARPRIEPFTGRLPTGESMFKVVEADPRAAALPRTANSPGRYVLSESVQLHLRQYSNSNGRENLATIVISSATGDFVRQPPEITLPDGLNAYAFAWIRGSGELWLVTKGVVQKFDISNPSQVKETRFEPGSFVNIPEVLHVALKEAGDFLDELP